MSYLALARKWRPKTFSTFVGQPAVTRLLTQSLQTERLHHAYLFTGTRGVGKTTVARLMAKGLNCLTGITATPCLTCDACVAIDEGRFMDFVEIDAASKTRVEDTKEMLEHIHYAPTYGRYKIYLIDEVHMLSQHSFNALLKTLEEPPAHVKFLLATTEPQKLPTTIRSRCLHCHLKPITAEDISTQLAEIIVAEGFSAEEGVTKILAQAALGSLRDALSLLDQAMASADKILSLKVVKALLGYTESDESLAILNALLTHDAIALLQVSQRLAAEGSSHLYVIDTLLDDLHQIALYQQVAGLDAAQGLSFSTDHIPFAKAWEPSLVQLFYQIALKGREDMLLSPSLRIGFEMVLLRLLAFKPQPIVSIITPTTPMTTLTTPIPESVIDVKSTPIVEVAPMPVVAVAPMPVAPEITETSTEETWDAVLSACRLTGLLAHAATHTEWVSKVDNRVTLRVDPTYQSIFTPQVIKRLETELGQYYQATIKLTCLFETPKSLTFAQRKSVQTQQQKEEALVALTADPVLTEIQTMFQATWESQGVTAILSNQNSLTNEV